MVVGEYGSDYGCFLPNPVSIHRECSRLRFRTEWCMKTLQKMKILGVRRSGIMMPNKIQPREYFKGWWYRWRFIHCYLTFNRWNDERNVNCNRNDNDWNDNWFLSGVPAPRNSLHFSPRSCGAEFCLVNCPFQPPSILPTSSSGTESAAYFFVSNDLVSQRTRSNTFSVSSLRIASRTHGCFSLLERKVAEAIASIVSMNKLSAFPPSVWRCAFGSI